MLKLRMTDDWYLPPKAEGDGNILYLRYPHMEFGTVAQTKGDLQMRKLLPFLTKFAKEPAPRQEDPRKTGTKTTPPPQTIHTRVNPETTDDA